MFYIVLPLILPHLIIAFILFIIIPCIHDSWSDYSGLPHYSVNVYWIKCKDIVETHTGSESPLNVLCRRVRHSARTSRLSKVKKKCLSPENIFTAFIWIFWNNRMLKMGGTLELNVVKKNISLRIRTPDVPALGKSLNISSLQPPNL